MTHEFAMSGSDPIDPYQPPASEPGSLPSIPRMEVEGQTGRVVAFVSPSGSFSRGELLIATIVLFATGMLFSSLGRVLPEILSPPVLLVLNYCLYGVWGIALGKRSRDLGTTFTYGMVVGLLFPVIGLVFLFQEGAKERAKKSLSARPPES